MGWGIFWLGVVIMPIKPHWGFALAIPLLLGRYKFFLKLLAGSLLAYLSVAGITSLAGGVEYGLRQYQDYFAFLARLARDAAGWPGRLSRSDRARFLAAYCRARKLPDWRWWWREIERRHQ